MENLKAPTLTEAFKGQQKAVTEKILNAIENEDLSLYLKQAEELMQKHTAVDLVAAMLKSMTKEPDQTPIRLTDEAPSPMRRDRNRGGSSSNRQRNGRSSSGNRKDFGGKRPSNRKSNSHGNRSSSQKRKQSY